MILSDLMRNTVLGPDGEKLGQVIDARFVVDGAPSVLLAEARLAGLVVSPHSGSSFLGYERHDTRSPWPIAEFLRWRHRGSFLVEWDDIARLDPSTVHLREGFRRARPPSRGG